MLLDFHFLMKSNHLRHTNTHIIALYVQEPKFKRRKNAKTQRFFVVDHFNLLLIITFIKNFQCTAHLFSLPPCLWVCMVYPLFLHGLSVCEVLLATKCHICCATKKLLNWSLWLQRLFLFSFVIIICQLQWTCKNVELLCEATNKILWLIVIKEEIDEFYLKIKENLLSIRFVCFFSLPML